MSAQTFRFNHLITNAISYACQEVPLPPDDRFDERFHFALDYRPDRAIPLGDNNPGLPDPHGFSGSFVWNTRFVELGSNSRPWSPDCAVFDWPCVGLALVHRVFGGDARGICAERSPAGSSSKWLTLRQLPIHIEIIVVARAFTGVPD